MTTPTSTGAMASASDAVVIDHEFKSHPSVFWPAAYGQKMFEYRRDDRGGYEVGQTVRLRCFDPASGYTADPPLDRRITNILRGGEFELPAGYCILGFASPPPVVPEEVRRLSEAATQGEWYVESEKCDGSYGSGEDGHEGYLAYSIVTDAEKPHGNPGVIAETSNSTIGEIHEEHDEYGTTAWDDVAKNNTSFIVAAVNFVRTLLATPSGRADTPPASAGAVDELTEDEIRRRAKTMVLDQGWKPGDQMSGHTVAELMTRFGLSIMRQPPQDRCAYPACGCDHDATCGNAFAAAPEPAAGGEREVFRQMTEAQAQAAAERVCHDEQMTIWSGDLAGALSMGGFLREDLDYEDKIHLGQAIASQIRDIAESVLSHPELPEPTEARTLLSAEAQTAAGGGRLSQAACDVLAELERLDRTPEPTLAVTGAEGGQR